MSKGGFLLETLPIYTAMHVTPRRYLYRELLDIIPDHLSMFNENCYGPLHCVGSLVNTYTNRLKASSFSYKMGPRNRQSEGIPFLVHVMGIALVCMNEVFLKFL